MVLRQGDIRTEEWPQNVMLVQLSVQLPSFRSQSTSEGAGAGIDVKRGAEVAGGPWRMSAKIGD